MTVAAAAVANLWAEQPGLEAERSAMVCLEPGSDGLVRTTAQPEVSRIFAEIGIRIDWRRDKQDCAATDGIIVTLSYEAPANQRPNAWAYAFTLWCSTIVCTKLLLTWAPPGICWHTCWRTN